VNMAKGKITSVKAELGHDVTPETAANAVAHGFTVTLNMQVVENVQSTEDTLTAEERALAQKLYEDKFVAKEWNFEGKTG
jgi:lipoate-protein ligase A